MDKHDSNLVHTGKRLQDSYAQGLQCPHCGKCGYEDDGVEICECGCDLTDPANFPEVA